MPALGMAQETGKILRWLKAEGEMLRAGEPVMEIETDKAVVEIEAPASGILSHVMAGEGDEVPVGQPVALILAEGETAPEPAPVSAAPTASRKTAPVGKGSVAASPVAARIAAKHHLDLTRIKPKGGRIEKDDVLALLDSAGAAVPGERVRASPKARRLAAQRGVDLAALAGSGPAGAVLTADLPGMATVSEEGIPTREAMSNTWRLMAERVTQAWTQVPHFYLLRELRADGLMDWLDEVRQGAQVKVTFTDLLVHLVAESLKVHPNVNSAWQGGSIVRQAEINIGLAMAVANGLVVPVVHRADTLGLEEIADRRTQLIERANAGRLHLDDIQGGSFTISNLGMYGVDAFNAILNASQAAILAVGKIADRVVAVGGKPEVHPTVFLSLTCDHRLVDGARGAQFLQTVAERIERPPTLAG